MEKKGIKKLEAIDGYHGASGTANKPLITCAPARN